MDLAIGGDGSTNVVEYGDGFVDVVFGGPHLVVRSPQKMFLWIWPLVEMVLWNG